MPPTDSIPCLPFVLSAVEARVLGALIEKEITTPDTYPLSLNALVHACNQRSSREPVMDLDKEAVRQILHSLEEMQLAGRARQVGGLVTKFEHWLDEVFNFSRAETALICVLLLRGPQTPGELRGRTERLHRFAEIADVLVGLQKLMTRTPQLVAVTARQPGTKEYRYAHLFSGAVEAPAEALRSAEALHAEETAAWKQPESVQQEAVEPVNFQPVNYQPAALQPESVQIAERVVSYDTGQEERIAQLEATVVELRQEIIAIRQRIEYLFVD